MSLVSSLDILSEALQKSGELQSSRSPYYAIALNYLNTVYRDVIAGTSHFAPDSGEPFVWARAQAPGVFALKAPYASGSASATNGSDMVTLDTPPAYSLKGYFFVFVGRQEFYRVLEHQAGQAKFQIDLPYADTTASGSFKLHKLDYVIGAQGAYVANANNVIPGAVLPKSIARLFEPIKVDRPQTFDGDGEGLIYGIDSQSFARSYPRFALPSGVPVRFTVIGEVDGEYTIRFNKSVSEDCRAEYEFIPVPVELTASASSIPLFPVEDRPFLSYATTYHVMVDKSDSRQDAYYRLAQQKLQSMFSERKRELAKTGAKLFGRLVPRTEQMQFALIRSASGLRF